MLLTPFFNPLGVVVIGVSKHPAKLGFGLARNLVKSGYRGAVHFVSPAGGTLLGRPVHTDLSAVPDPVDLAVLLIPAPLVPETLKACAARGIRAVVIGSGGFRETGPEGAALEEECLHVARAHDVRLIGPNCVGLINTHLPLDTTFLPPPGPPVGDIAFISHSGAICAVVIDWARGQGFGLSHLISLGNQVDLCETDLLAPVAADPETHVLTLYLEGLTDGRRFVAEATRVSRQKPILALKVGRSEGGRRAVASHTGALAGREAAYDAAFRRAGVIRAETSEGLFDWARALAWCPLPQGPRVAVLTNAGGPGVTAADALDDRGLAMAELSDATREALAALLPPAAGLHNPVDMLASASPEQYAESLRLLLADPGVDSVMIILPPPPMSSAGAVARAVIPVLYGAGKPVVVALMGERMIQEAVEYFRAARVPEYRFPERAAAALAVLSQRAGYLSRPPAEPVTFSDTRAETVEAILVDAVPGETGFLDPVTAAAVLAAYGVPVAMPVLARTVAEAGAQAQAMGFPVALKVAGDLPHKSDAGGVLLGLADERSVAEGFETILRNVGAAMPGLAVPGVYVQRMARGGQEVIVGAVQDAQFGALAMFGAGGVEVEGLRDVAFALAPLTQHEAEEMMEKTWAGRKLKGYRNLPPADRAAALDTLLRVARLAADVPAIAEVEVNPLRVLPEGQGAVAVDVRVRVNRDHADT